MNTLSTNKSNPYSSASSVNSITSTRIPPDCSRRIRWSIFALTIISGASAAVSYVDHPITFTIRQTIGGANVALIAACIAAIAAVALAIYCYSFAYDQDEHDEEDVSHPSNHGSIVVEPNPNDHVPTNHPTHPVGAPSNVKEDMDDSQSDSGDYFDANDGTDVEPKN